MKLQFKPDSAGWAILLMVLVAILAIVLGPLLVIWSLNTLFPALAIPFTWYTWLATAILLMFVMPSVRISHR